ncbi:hypothetical protein [Ekhidna sp.]|uniref:hypothetical protein n=1 Tax=Ekhidna sp. TaxID=2608089 RepID=UPI003299207F
MKQLSRYFAFALLLLPLWSNSQGLPSLTGAGRQHDIETWLERNKLRSFNENDDTLGDRFLYEEWKTGSVETTDSLKVDKIELKYDLLFDALIGKIRGSMTTLRKENIRNFTVIDNGKKLHFQTVYHNDRMLFLQIIYTGTSINLYKQHSVRLEEKDAGNQAYGSGVAYDKYVYKEEFFIERGESGLTSINNSKGAILKLLADKKEEIKDYIKRESLNVKEEQDLGLVLKYYESIKN